MRRVDTRQIRIHDGMRFRPPVHAWMSRCVNAAVLIVMLFAAWLGTLHAFVDYTCPCYILGLTGNNMALTLGHMQEAEAMRSANGAKSVMNIKTQEERAKELKVSSESTCSELRVCTLACMLACVHMVCTAVGVLGWGGVGWWAGETGGTREHGH